MFTELQKTNILAAKEVLLDNLIPFDNLFHVFCADVMLRESLWKSNVFVSGGAIASILQKEKPKDIDIYFNQETVAINLINWIKLNRPELIDTVDKKYTETVGVDGKSITTNATTLLLSNSVLNDNVKIQLITRHYGSVEDITSSFDFIHCCTSFKFDDKKLYISPKQYDCIIRKILLINNHNSLTDKRIRKFTDRGYRYVNTY